MLHLTDRAAITAALASDIDPALRDLLATRAAALVTDDYDLTDCTEFLIVEEGDTEADIVAAVGFSPLVDPIDGYRIDERGFQPGWDWLADQGEWLELSFSFGSDAAVVTMIARTSALGNAIKDLMV
ncbi:hypothetical protein KZ810_13960 [Sphingomonas sp. RHCKR47]|uniref:hypothetical protein n=1 Tax=Sphingomonas citricola TaxID=2862498 RepID=UPI001CA4951E|nr:hypothetical protein [Sphingomonas citricola]MBW6524606.1 hypothetical protein [Sphingomonas citricola]